MHYAMLPDNKLYDSEVQSLINYNMLDYMVRALKGRRS